MGICDRMATAPLTTVPVAASGTFNPLHGVLCILRSLYLCAIGPRSVCFLATDTRRTSNCSPKPLYSGMRAHQSPDGPAHTLYQTGQSPSVVVRSRTLPGALVTETRLPAPQPTASEDNFHREPVAIPFRKSHLGWYLARSFAITAAIAVACISSTE